MINGVIVQELKQVVDERGKVMHMLRADSQLFTRFGEIYFSLVNPGMIKAWKQHLRMTQHFAVPVGKIKLVLYDSREDSSTYGKIDIFEVGEDNYYLIRIPALVWYGFQCLSSTPSLITNCTDLPHDPAEVLRLDRDTAQIPFKW